MEFQISGVDGTDAEYASISPPCTSPVILPDDDAVSWTLNPALLLVMTLMLVAPVLVPPVRPGIEARLIRDSVMVREISDVTSCLVCIWRDASFVPSEYAMNSVKCLVQMMRSGDTSILQSAPVARNVSIAD